MKDISLKLEGMRKAQNFCIYPVKKGETKVLIQSSTRIGQFDLTTGKGIFTKKAIPGGAIYVHLNKALGAVDFTLPAVDLQTIKMQIFVEGPELSIGGGIVLADNSGALTILG